MTNTDTRTGYFVIFCYLGIGDARSRETTVYLAEGESFGRMGEIIGRSQDLPEHRVVIFESAPLAGLTRETADAMRAVGKEWDEALKG
jgi:hypothetical protein